MNVVALVSGGKDSCYSILQCQKHGHKVVALGNLLPPDSSVDELDSYMYQTVGHQLVAAYASCTGLPLYRRRIQGSSHSQGLSYSTTAGDEVEDLLLLLAYIKEVHPEVQAVASGAIASDYQRLRVESVCSRLGLVSLGYLWHQPQEQLLADMIANDIEAVLVKVAALGLEPHKHLGKSIRQLQPHLHRLRDRFGCNVCGEGGEYETLTLDCPAFTRGRIVLDSWEVVLHSPDSIAAVGVLHPTGFHIEPKQAAAGGSCAAAAAAAAAAVADGCPAVTEVPLDWQPQQQAPTAAHSSTPAASTQHWDTHLKVAVSGQHVHIMCTAHAAGAADGSADAGASPPAATTAGGISAEQTASAAEAALLAVGAQLQQLLGTTSWQHSCFVHLYLADMSHFAVANAAYCRHLPQVDPPSRACVQVPLPAGCPVLLDVLFARCPAPDSSRQAMGLSASHQQQQQQQQLPDRRVLHVQSISDWAPSCIGPYSQATSCNGIIHMAGQIPLDPGSMSIIASCLQQPPNGTSSSSSSTHAAWTVAAQVWRTLCSCQAVAVAVKSCCVSSCLGLTVYLTPTAAAAGGRGLVQAALQAVRQQPALLNRPDQLPAALLAAAAAAAGEDAAAAAVNGSAGAAGVCSEQGGSSEEDEEGGDQEPYLDDYLRPPQAQELLQPTVVYLTVPELPKGALLEVQPLLVDLATAAAAQSSSSSSDDEAQKSQPAAALGPVEAHLSGAEDLQHHRVVLDVTQPSRSNWRRVLLQLQQQQDSNSTNSSAGPKAQVAAAGRWLAARCAPAPTSPASPACQQPAEAAPAAPAASLRCWYDSREQVDAVRSGGWGPTLLAELQPEVARRLQLVPVLGAATQQAGSCRCVIELLECV